MKVITWFQLKLSTFYVAKKQWLQAVEEDGMTWPQFQVDFLGPLMKAYNVTAIPDILLIAPNKKIYKVGVRGLDLDLILKDIYGF